MRSVVASFILCPAFLPCLEDAEAAQGHPVAPLEVCLDMAEKAVQCGFNVLLAQVRIRRTVSMRSLFVTFAMLYSFLTAVVGLDEDGRPVYAPPPNILTSVSRKVTNSPYAQRPGPAKQMNKELLDLYSDYLISSFSYTTATGLSGVLEGGVSHDKVTRFLSNEELDAKTLWKSVKALVRKYEREEGVLVVDDTIIEEPIYLGTLEQKDAAADSHFGTVRLL